jgi:hypothetical protein
VARKAIRRSADTPLPEAKSNAVESPVKDAVKIVPASNERSPDSDAAKREWTPPGKSSHDIAVLLSAPGQMSSAGEVPTKKAEQVASSTSNWLRPFRTATTKVTGAQ